MKKLNKRQLAMLDTEEGAWDLYLELQRRRKLRAVALAACIGLLLGAWFI